MLALAEGKIDLASGPLLLPFVLSRAIGPYSNIEKDKVAELAANIQLLYPYTLSVFSLFAYDAKGITGRTDLKGLKVLNGPPRGTATIKSRGLVHLFGGLKSEEDYESESVNWIQMAATIIDGTADAAAIPVMFPGPRVSRAGRSRGDDLVLDAQRHF